MNAQSHRSKGVYPRTAGLPDTDKIAFFCILPLYELNDRSGNKQKMQIDTASHDKHFTFHNLAQISAAACAGAFKVFRSCLGSCLHLSGIALIICFFCLSTFNTVSASPEISHSSTGYFDMPLEYGEVIYRINAQSPKQLYIIGISHKDPDSGENDSTTVQTQMEIFRIGEWLKKEMHLNLLLPEGYFSDKHKDPSLKASIAQPIRAFHPVYPDNGLIQKKLAAHKPYMNAEMLLMEYHSFHASQVEDRNTYDAVRSSLGKLKTTSAGLSKSAGNMAELLYLQEVRTAQLLQNIPDVIEDEFLNGAIGNRTALFTIGLNHIKDIFRYINNDEIHIASPIGSDIQPDVLNTRPNLLKTGYGVTIIIPRTLANNHKLLEMTRIDRIILADGKYSVSTLHN
jgi:hypothetical protein